VHGITDRQSHVCKVYTDLAQNCHIYTEAGPNPNSYPILYVTAVLLSVPVVSAQVLY